LVKISGRISIGLLSSHNI